MFDDLESYELSNNNVLQERVTATPIGQMFDDLGGAVSYLIRMMFFRKK